MSLHKIRNFSTGERKRCRCEIDTADKFVADTTGINLFGPSDDEWNMDTAVIEELLTTNMRPSVVTHEKDDGIVGESLIIKSQENLPDLSYLKSEYFRDRVPNLFGRADDRGSKAVIQRSLVG